MEERSLGRYLKKYLNLQFYISSALVMGTN